MKLPAEKTAMILIICRAAIAIFCVFFFYDAIFHSLNYENNSLTSPLFLDSEFEIQEVNVSQGTDQTIIHVTSDEIRTITGLEEALQGTDNNSKPWVRGRKLITDFEGNGTQYETFVSKVCTGKTLTECFGYNGVLFEYQGHYYDIMTRYTRDPRAPARAPSRTSSVNLSSGTTNTS
jgi:hypothetical protein